MFNVCKNGSKFGVFGQQLRGILIKKWILFRRNLISSLCLTLFPVLILGLGIYSDKSNREGKTQPMVFTTDRLTNLITPISSSDATDTRLLEEYKKQLPSSEFPEIVTVIVHVQFLHQTRSCYMLRSLHLTRSCYIFSSKVQIIVALSLQL